MESEYEGAHVRFVYQNVLMGSIGKADYPGEWKHPDNPGQLSVQRMAAWADKRWPKGSCLHWPTLGIPAELS